jgi:hypothetical protein
MIISFLLVASCVHKPLAPPDEQPLTYTIDSSVAYTPIKMLAVKGSLYVLYGKENGGYEIRSYNEEMKQTGIFSSSATDISPTSFCFGDEGMFYVSVTTSHSNILYISQVPIDLSTEVNLNVITFSDSMVCTGINSISPTLQCVSGYTIKNGSRQALLIFNKPNSNYIITWGGSLNDVSLQTLKLPDGQLGILGYTYSFGKGDRDFYYSITDTLGTAPKTFTYGTSAYEEPHTATLGNDKSIYWCGHSAGFGHTEHNGYILNIKPDGTFISENNAGTAGHDGIQDVNLLANGTILGAIRTTAIAPDEDIAGVFINSNLSEQKTQRFADTSSFDNPLSVESINNHYYILGTKMDTNTKASKTVICKGKY